MRDNTAIFIDKEVDIDMILGSNKRFIKIGDMIINRADITSVISKEQYDVMMKQKNGMVLTSLGWLGRKEYQNNGFLKIQVPEELVVRIGNVQLEDGKKE